jgi:spore coat polysaccharide biosynthesis predicted glycosyltransferase SpsG/CMP-N-acetylneuraminic acid synthetase
VKKTVIIPAVKKNVAFHDDLVKKLAGRSLIERSVSRAKEIVERENIYVVTDSEEIRLFCQRKYIHCFYEKSLKLNPGAIAESIITLLSSITNKYETLILLSPYAPLLKANEIRKALKEFESRKAKLVIPVKKEAARIFTGNQKDIHEILNGKAEGKLLVESQSFQIIDSDLIKNNLLGSAGIKPHIYELDHNLIEIKSYQDWWVCEKLLRRKRIVFRVIGDEKVGMGHIQRALTLAHEIIDHEIIFVCEANSQIAVIILEGFDYWLKVCKPDEIEDKIVALEPDLIINDILDSDPNYIRKIRAKNISVINFEDLGEGAELTNLTINELYDDPLIAGENILWGQEYFFVREEFDDAKPNKFHETIQGLLIMFGGTDPNDYTRKILRIVKSVCRKNNIKIYVITGGGYPFINELEEAINQMVDADIEYHHSINVVSHIMEKVQIAISANGRTAYELAHMNIPSIVLSHHERENSHKFTREENGHIPLGIYKGAETEEKVRETLERLTADRVYRKMLFDRMEPFKFTKNKERVVNLIHSMLKH